MSYVDPKLHQASEPTESIAPLTRAAGSARDPVPDWMPWAVLTALVGLGMLGGSGVLPLGFLKQRPSATATSMVPSSTPSARAAAKSIGAAAATSASASAFAGKEPVITASHIVVSYEGTLLAARQRIQRTKEDAKKRAEEALARARKGEDFGKLVAEYSDEPKAAEKKGLVGTFAQRHAVKGWGEAAFALAPGEYSDVVETAFGYHVILRNQ